MSACDRSGACASNESCFAGRLDRNSAIHEWIAAMHRNADLFSFVTKQAKLSLCVGACTPRTDTLNGLLNTQFRHTNMHGRANWLRRGSGEKRREKKPLAAVAVVTHAGDLEAVVHSRSVDARWGSNNHKYPHLRSCDKKWRANNLARSARQKKGPGTPVHVCWCHQARHQPGRQSAAAGRPRRRRPLPRGHTRG